MVGWVGCVGIDIKGESVCVCFYVIVVLFYFYRYYVFL